MDLIWQKFTEWLKELLISGIMDNVNGLFDNVNSRVAGIAGQVGATPQGWNSGVYGIIRTLSDNPQHRAGVLPAPQTAPVQDEQFLRPAEPAGYFG